MKGKERIRLSSCTRCLIAIAGLILIFTSSCKNKDTSQPGYQRVTGSTFSYHDEPARINTMSYKGNHMTESIAYDTNMQEMSRATISYSGDLISSVAITYQQITQWTMPYTYTVTWYDSENPLEIICHSYDEPGHETSGDKYIYTYEGGLLTRIDEYFSNYPGNWKLSYFTTFKYDNSGRVIQEMGDTNNSYAQIKTYSYDALHRTEALVQGYFTGTITDEKKIIYTYVNQRLAKATTWYWESGTWVKKEEESYAYNEAGNLVKDRLEGTYFATQEVDYNYSGGSGNFSQCIKVTRGKLILPGDPTPMPAKSLFPKPENQVNYQ